MHFCVLCFELVPPERMLACGHVFHARCKAAWWDAYNEDCPMCPVEKALNDSDSIIGWDFVLYVDKNNPAALQSFFEHDEAAAGVLFDLITGSPLVTAPGMFSLRGFSHPVFLAFVAHIARTEPALLTGFVASITQGARRKSVSEVCGFLALVQMVNRPRA